MALALGADIDAWAERDLLAADWQTRCGIEGRSHGADLSRARIYAT
ncbi:MAG: hypothetical protein ABSC06_24685 [Rhodopila sp.]